MFKSSTIIKIFNVFSFVIFAIVVGKLFYLQVIDKEKYVQLVESQSDPKLTVLTDRGYIYDKEGNSRLSQTYGMVVWIYSVNQISMIT